MNLEVTMVAACFHLFEKYVREMSSDGPLGILSDVLFLGEILNCHPSSFLLKEPLRSISVAFHMVLIFCYLVPSIQVDQFSGI